ncbi:hypothetical protein J2J97_32545 (plasmid) [Rhizobium bangladeshense]|uniref:hypothetical protein n=1 Tax=Rhizobium bangladeshense TaxID=1138189 RepID=UPI001A985AE3|nr:hypothetical protein [Rhizobium bangladeshense]QSY98635.1 hypothetical protein J2J97_32545 [Rhizobium bangladeshense]
MLSIQSRARKSDVLLAIEQEDSRRDVRYVVFANGVPVDGADTIIKAKRAANAFVGEHVFDLKEARVHA